MLEERFARDVRKELPDWEILREPVPIEVDGTLVFPDFELRHRQTPERRALVEIVGFWTEDYLAAKAGRLERSGRRDVVLCVDEDRCTAARELAPSLDVVPYRKRIDPHQVVAAIDRINTIPPATETRHVEMRDLFIDFAGRQSPTDALHDTLTALQPGDHVDLVPKNGKISVQANGRIIALLGRGGNARHVPHVHGRTAAIVHRKCRRAATASAPRYRGLLKCPQWWIVELRYRAQSIAHRYLEPGNAERG
jgi:hypothetical protein